MRRALSLALLVTLVLAGPAAGLPFLQYGVDAARTGATQDPGPVSLDMAFNTTAPDLGRDAGPWGALPVILDGAVYALQGVNPTDVADAPDIGDEPLLAEPGPAFIERIDLATAERSVLVHLGDRVITSALISDGERLFVTVDNELRAFHARSGEPAWARPYVFPTLTATPPKELLCNPGAIAEGVLYLPCHQTADAGLLILDRFAASRPIVVALDTITGAERWRWTPEPHDLKQGADDALTARAMSYSPHTVAVGDGRIFVPLRGFPATAVSTAGRSHGAGLLYGLEADTGAVLWSRAFEGVLTPEVAPTGAGPSRTVSSTSGHLRLLYTPGVLYVKQMYLAALDPATGENLWDLRLVPDDDAAETTGHTLAIYADRLFATAFSTLYAIDVRTHTIAWQTPLPEGESWADVESITVAAGSVYAIAASGRVYRFDVEEGSIVEQREIPGADRRFGVGEGVLAALGGDGRVLVLGRTDAAIRPQAVISDAYPAPGATVTLDLSGTRPGVLHPRTEARVDWGDGTLTSWTTETRFEHVYNTAAERTIAMRMRNPAGQEASATLLVHVGATPPPELNLAQRAFARDNQDLTFGVLGILIAVTGGLWAVGRRHRHHSRLDEELSRLRRIRERGLEDPPGAARELDAFAARIEESLSEGTLNDAQFSVLMLQVSDLRRTLRKRAVAPLAGRVSPAFRLALDAALEDGHVTAAEADALKAALKREKGLKASDRREVVETIDAWAGPREVARP